MTGPGSPPADRLSIVTFGPGFGESTVVRAPPGEWLVIDSLLEPGTGRNPALELLRAEGAQPSRLVLTHPHEDHAAGFDRLVDAQADGLVGCVVDDATLADDPLADPDAARALWSARAQHAQAAVWTRWETSPDSRWPLEMGSSMTLGDATLRILSPYPPTVERARDGRNVDANALSAAIAVEWESVRVVLAADLPGAEWAKVVRDWVEAEPGDHGGLKLPHHGSKSAQHQSLWHPRDGRSRTWWLTPWNRNGKLPRFHDGEGIDIALGAVPSVTLTCLPFELRGSTGERSATRTTVEEAIGRGRFGSDDMLLEYEAPAPPAAPDAWVRVSFSADGTAMPIERGPAAWEILA